MAFGKLVGKGCIDPWAGVKVCGAESRHDSAVDYHYGGKKCNQYGARGTWDQWYFPAI
jgi:hypothetical protein